MWPSLAQTLRDVCRPNNFLHPSHSQRRLITIQVYRGLNECLLHTLLLVRRKKKKVSFYHVQDLFYQNRYVAHAHCLFNQFAQTTDRNSIVVIKFGLELTESLEAFKRVSLAYKLIILVAQRIKQFLLNGPQTLVLHLVQNYFGLRLCHLRLIDLLLLGLGESKLEEKRILLLNICDPLPALLVHRICIEIRVLCQIGFQGRREENHVLLQL